MVDIPDREAVVLVDEYGVPYKAGGAASGGTSATDNDAFTVDSGSGTPAMGYVGNDAVTAGNVGVLGMLGNRQLKVTVYDSNGDEVSFGGDGGGGGEVTGNVASEDADSGNPVKVGGKYNSTRPTFTDGDRADFQTDSRGMQGVSLFAADTAIAAGFVADNADGVSVSATANKQQTINRLTVFNGSTWDRIRGDTTNGLDVDVTRSALPSGASTSANQTTIIGHLDGVEGLLTTIDADTGGILTAVQTLDNAISGNEMQVDVVASLPAGNNNIGDVDVASIAAGTNLIGLVSGGINTDGFYQGATSRTVGRAIIDAASSGDNTLLAAQGASNKIRVHAAFMIAAGDVTARFESGASGTALTGQMTLKEGTGFVLPFNPLGWFETAANTLLNLELSGAVSVDGCFQYSVVQ